jgi:hypothetical protein
MKEGFGIIPSIYTSLSGIIDGFISIDSNAKARHTALQTGITTSRNDVTTKLREGDTLFGAGATAGTNTISAVVKQRQDDIQKKVTDLKKQIERKYQIIQTNDRDFADYLDKGEKTNDSRLLSLEDYTVFVFLISYLFMACMFIYTYTYMADATAMAQQFGKALGLTVLVTIVGGMIFYSAV